MNITEILALVVLGYSPSAAEFTLPVSIFHAECEARGIEVPYRVTVQFDETLNDETQAGTCSYDTRTVRINPRIWNSIGKYQQEQLIFHELGHCALNLPHTEEGIMRGRMLNSGEYEKNRNALVNDLFLLYTENTSLGTDTNFRDCGPRGSK